MAANGGTRFPRPFRTCELIMRTTLKAVAVAAAVLVSLTACEKPKPEITVFSGGNSVHTEAVCWSHDAGTGCDTKAITGSNAELAVASGSTIGISVDSDVAEAGWVPQLVISGNAQALTQGTLHRRYWRMQYPEVAGTSLMGQSLTLQVVSVTDDQKSARGVWSVVLTPAESLDNA